MPEVVPLPGQDPDSDRPAIHDVPRMLRKLADDIEKGEPADVRNAVVVLEIGEAGSAVYGFGPEAGDPLRNIGLLETGKVLVLMGEDED